MSLLETKGLSRQFGGVLAVAEANFSLQEGEVHALIGPNGAGKSTFVGMVAGRISPSAGTVRFDGADITALPAHKRIRLGMAYTFQITSVYANLTCLENVRLALRDHGEDPTGPLAAVGLEARAEDQAGDLSYGHQRLLEIAMGLAQHPRLLILDEPTQGLAEAEIAGFQDIIRGLRSTTTVLLIEHNMSVVMALADRITVLDQGRILATGTPDEVRANKAVQDAYLGGGDAAA